MSNDNNINDPAAQVEEGDRYYYGNGAEKDFAQAAAWYEKAAQQGYAQGQYFLGYCYYAGEGVEQDYKQAVYWWTKAAEQGDLTAQNKLGCSYLDGVGVECDPQKAVYWLEKIVYMNDPDEAEIIWETRWILAEMYECGLYNVSKDIKKAIEYYKLLAENGDKSADVYIKLLSQGKEEPINSRGWSIKHLVAKILINDFPEFDAVEALYEERENYEDIEFTNEEKEACLPAAERIMELADLAKRESILAFAAEAEKEKDMYLKTALKMAADGIHADLFAEVINVLFIKEKPQGAELLRRFIIHRGVYLIIRGDFSLQRLKVLLGSLYVPQLLLPKNNDRNYKMTFNYLLTHREIPKLFFESLDEFYKTIITSPEMMQRFLFFAYNRCKYFAMENPDIEPAFKEEEFEMYLYGNEGREVLVITLPKWDNPPESYQIAIPTARQKAAYYTCELSVDPLTIEPCFIFGKWDAEHKHTNYGKIEMINENGFAQTAIQIAYGAEFED